MRWVGGSLTRVEWWRGVSRVSSGTSLETDDQFEFAGAGVDWACSVSRLNLEKEKSSIDVSIKKWWGTVKEVWKRTNKRT